MQVTIDLHGMLSGQVQYLEGRLAGPSGSLRFGPKVRAVFEALAEGVRLARQASEETKVSLPLTELSDEDGGGLVLEVFALRQTFAKAGWPQIAALFSEILIALEAIELHGG
jgi:hypothetical protein